MVQKDYIMRMFEQVTAVILQQVAAIMVRTEVHREAENYDQALIEIDLAYQTLLQLDPNQIKLMTEDEIVDLLSPDGNFDAEKSLVIAELLREEAEIQELTSGLNDTTFNLSIRSVYLYVEATMNDKRFHPQQYSKKIDPLIQKISQYELAPHIRFKLFQYYEQIGSFGQAEDILYELMDLQYANILADGQAFYTRLLEKSDHDLATGNLPRDEVQEGLAQLGSRPAYSGIN